MRARLAQATKMVLPGIAALTSAGILSLGFDIWQTTRADHQLRIESQEASFAASYDALSREYLRFLEMCLTHIEARACLAQEDIPDDALTTDAREKRALLYEYLLSIFERAFLYRDLTDTIRQEIWPGWDAYIRDYLGRATFQDTLEGWRYDDGSLGMNPRFEVYLNQALAEVE
jgi:hypothetical protein